MPLNEFGCMSLEFSTGKNGGYYLFYDHFSNCQFGGLFFHHGSVNPCLFNLYKVKDHPHRDGCRNRSPARRSGRLGASYGNCSSHSAKDPLQRKLVLFKKPGSVFQ
jgi:hypothetical protein